MFVVLIFRKERSIDPGYIALEYEERHSWRIPIEYIKSVEILEYSTARAMEGVFQK